MKVKVIQRLGQKPIEAEGNTIIVEDNFGNPLVIVQSLADNTCVVTDVRDPRFLDILHGLGINRLVVNNPLQLQHSLPTDHQALDVGEYLRRNSP